MDENKKERGPAARWQCKREVLENYRKKNEADNVDTLSAS
jgi:hypothetical protein